MMESLKEADAIVNGERQNQYGGPEDSFKLIGEFWATYINSYLPKEHRINIMPIDVAHMMTLLKIARMLGQKPKRDNYIDAIGYLAIAVDRLTE